MVTINLSGTVQNPVELRAVCSDNASLSRLVVVLDGNQIDDRPLSGLLQEVVYDLGNLTEGTHSIGTQCWDEAGNLRDNTWNFMVGPGGGIPVIGGIITSPAQTVVGQGCFINGYVFADLTGYDVANPVTIMRVTRGSTVVPIVDPPKPAPSQVRMVNCGVRVYYSTILLGNGQSNQEGYFIVDIPWSSLGAAGITTAGIYPIKFRSDGISFEYPGVI